MKDTLEANLPIEETGKLENTMNDVVSVETTVSESAPADNVETVNTEVEAESTVAKVGRLTKEEILSTLTELVAASAESSRSEIDMLKQAYYKIRRTEVEELKKSFLADGGEEVDFVAPEDETDIKLKELLATYKEIRTNAIAAGERLKAENYTAKLALIQRIKALTERQEDFNKLYNEFKEIQQQWKEIKLVPAEHVNDLWKSYQVYSEQFYDLIKINNEFRDYDFKKNLTIKTSLCEAVEKLNDESDVVSAFHQLQKLHLQWREVGPVAREIREEVWARFKNASTLVNKKHQAYFEMLKAKEQQNFEDKTVICETIEQIDFDSLKTFKEWETKNVVIVDLQKQWKTIGYAPKKANVQVFERFRAACDLYFLKKSDFYKSIKEGMDKNLERKRELCEKAEALKDSTDWKEATDKMIALQKEWKTLGSVSRKYSDSIWKRFITACDFFFEQKGKTVSSQKSVEHENLAKKKALIAQVTALSSTDSAEEAISLVKNLTAEWNTVGHVPFKEKDKVYKEFHGAVDALYDRLKIDRSERKMQSFRSNVDGLSEGGHGKGKLLNERDRLFRLHERLKGELQTYENNLGFLSISSKGGNSFVKEINRKIETLKEEIKITLEKVQTIDGHLN